MDQLKIIKKIMIYEGKSLLSLLISPISIMHKAIIVYLVTVVKTS